MLKLIRAQVNKWMDSGRFSDGELYAQLTLLGSTFCAGLMHVALFTAMLINSMWFMVIVNIGSLIVYTTGVVLLVKYEKRMLGSFILSFEVIVYVLLSTLYTGPGDYAIMFFFVLVFMQLTLPYASMRARSVVVLVVWISSAVVMLSGNLFSWLPFFAARPTSLGMAAFHLNLSFLGTVAVILVANAARGLIDRSNAYRMEEYKSQANTDSLTGLRNRRYSQSVFDELTAKGDADEYCFAMLDIDNFKSVNDTLGHPAGDEVLRAVSSVLRENLRKADTIFRWGGEEFLIVLADIELDNAHRLMEKIREQIACAAILHTAGTTSVTVTIGVGRLDSQNIADSIALCDQRLYKGKQNGKNQVVSES